MKQIQNPILPGFHPDPSILRVGDDYYIANSTFEWFPGVVIHHSKDLVHWELVGYPLNRTSQLNMFGSPDSGGIWAPCLTYADNLYWLIYTDVRTASWPYLDTPNYLVTAENVEGPWSEPVYLNSSGFDPSLFHDDDGRKWLLNMIQGNVNVKNPFAGIVLQEYDHKQKKLVGPVKNIFSGTEIGFTEGPHLYKINGYYYLLTAEGGTDRSHAVSLCRSVNLEGPYEIHPENPLLTSLHDSSLKLQKSGHGDLVETQNGEWYLTHLCSRPNPSRGWCNLGRETGIQKIIWGEDGWPRLEAGGNQPREIVPSPDLPEFKARSFPEKEDFDTKQLPQVFQTLRIPLGADILNLEARPGWLRITGKESPASRFTQALIARRQEAFRMTAETKVDFNPDNFQHMAGIINYYNTKNFYYCYVTRNLEGKKILGISAALNGVVEQKLDLTGPVLPEEKPVYLKSRVIWDRLRFAYSLDGREWEEIGPNLDAATLSDEFCGLSSMAFTGAYTGLCCQDLAGTDKPADFDYFIYRED